MALVGKWTKIEQVASETETQLVTIQHPSKEIMGADHPDIDKAGTTEEVEVPVVETLETIFENAYVVVHSINSWKHIQGEETKPLFNITYRVYETKENRTNDYENYILQDYIVGQEVNYSIEKNEVEQAYDFVKTVQGFEELIND